MNVLLIGSGAREHALAWKLRQSPQLDQLFIAPGNAGTASLGTNLPIAATDVFGLSEAIRDLGIDFVVVGPEDPLALGVVDLCQELGVPAFGPTKGAARIESSKSFAKELLARAGVPIARSSTFTDYEAARRYLAEQPVPIVVKADGLAAGKGTFVCMTREEAETALEEIFVRRAFGAAGERVLIEEYLEGWEVSLLALVDGKHIVPLVPACDYKRAHDGDAGPNTGGMGAYSPPKAFGPAEVEKAVEGVLRPTVRALAEEGTPFRGCLYAGLMVTREGPKVLEFNARFGDPEAQVILPRLESDLLELLWAAAHGQLAEVRMRWREEPCVGVVVASGGYPGPYERGLLIEGLDAVGPDALVFHAGTKLTTDEAGRQMVVTDGGRILTVVALGATMAEARERAYANVGRIRIPGAFYRRDIALREL